MFIVILKKDVYMCSNHVGLCNLFFGNLEQINRVLESIVTRMAHLEPGKNTRKG